MKIVTESSDLGVGEGEGDVCWAATAPHVDIRRDKTSNRILVEQNKLALRLSRLI